MVLMSFTIFPQNTTVTLMNLKSTDIPLKRLTLIYCTLTAPNCTFNLLHMYPALPYYAFLLTSTLPLYSFTEFEWKILYKILNSTYPAAHHCTGNWQAFHPTIPYFVISTDQNYVQLYIPTESHWGSCTGLWPALYTTVHHCTIHLSKLFHTERHYYGH